MKQIIEQIGNNINKGVVNQENMKKSTSTTYKEFIQQIGKAKMIKAANKLKIKPVIKQLNNNHHTQSTWILEKRSPSHTRLDTDVSGQKKIKSHNQSTNLQIKSHGISKKDKIMCYHRFITQATGILTQLFKIPTPQLLTNRISYIDYLSALKSLKMIHQNYQPYPNDIISQLWSQYISGHNVGLYNGKHNYDDKHLKYKYQGLKFTRLELHKSFGHQHFKENQCTFMPQISERSKKLAGSGSKSKKTLTNLQLQQSLNSDRALTQRINIINEQRNKHQIQQQQPDENIDTIQQIHQIKINRSGNKRSQILYQKSKQKYILKKLNKTTQDIQYQKNINQLTFKPRIIIKNKNKINCNQHYQQPHHHHHKYQIKGQKNIINRMIKGRVQREIKKIINDKGVPYNQKFVDKMRKQKYQEIVTSVIKLSDPPQNQQLTNQNQAKNNIPKLAFQPKPDQSIKSNPLAPQQDLIIDVYISQDHKQKLIIRKGQSLEQVASRFIQDNGLSAQKKQQLIQLLEVSITHALCPIDQLVEEEDQLASARSQHKRSFFK